MEDNSIKLFESKQIRTAWDEEQEKWYFSVVDVVAALTDSANPTDYLKKMRQRDPELSKGWGQIVTPLTYKTAKAYKKFKGLKKENLRDNMTNEELVLNMLAELSTTSITRSENPSTLKENMDVAARGGKVARVAREELEAQTGKKVVSPLSAKRFFEGQKPTLPFDETDKDK